jgi:RNA polymerase sigma-70 factor, ECF subfamily
MNQAEPTDARLSDPAAEQMLVLAAKNGDGQAFETLFKRNQQKLLRVVQRYTRVPEDAEDIVQQSFHKAFVHLCKFEGKSSFSTWLTRIAVNEALMFLRTIGAVRKISIDEASEQERTSSALEIHDSRPDPETSYMQQERAQILSEALADLRPGMRKAVALREFAELSTKETAQQMNLSVGAVKARLFHARRKLREKLSRRLRAHRIPGNFNGPRVAIRYAPVAKARFRRDRDHKINNRGMRSMTAKCA